MSLPDYTEMGETSRMTITENAPSGPISPSSSSSSSRVSYPSGNASESMLEEGGKRKSITLFQPQELRALGVMSKEESSVRKAPKGYEDTMNHPEDPRVTFIDGEALKSSSSVAITLSKEQGSSHEVREEQVVKSSTPLADPPHPNHCFSQLPFPIKLAIISYLPLRDRLVATHVCASLKRDDGLPSLCTSDDVIFSSFLLLFLARFRESGGHLPWMVLVYEICALETREAFCVIENLGSWSRR